MTMMKMFNTLRKVDKLRVEKAIKVSHWKGDEFNHFRYSQMNPERLTEAERRDIDTYLWGSEQFTKTIKELEEL